MKGVPKQRTISQILVEKTLRELNQPQKVSSRSRVWQDPEGYRYLVQWSNLVLLRFLIRLLTRSLPRSEYRRKAQLDDAGRSSIRNLEEGYKRSTTSEYLNFIGYGQGSLEEIKGDVRELTEDGFLKSKPGSRLTDIGINLADFHRAVRKTKGDYRKVKDDKGGFRKQDKPSDWFYHPLTLLYPPLKNIWARDLTYEVFLELINKTDYLLRRLVISLEKKLGHDQRAYQIEKARIRSNLKWKR